MRKAFHLRKITRMIVKSGAHNKNSFLIVTSLKKFSRNLCKNWKVGAKAIQVWILRINWKISTQHSIAVPMQKSFQLIINVHAKARSLPLLLQSILPPRSISKKQKPNSRRIFNFCGTKTFHSFASSPFAFGQNGSTTRKSLFPHLVHPPRKEISHHTHISRSFFRAPAEAPLKEWTWLSPARVISSQRLQASDRLSDSWYRQ